MANREALSELIYSNGKTYSSCAKELNMSANTFTKIMNGNRKLHEDEIDTLIDFLNITNNDVKVSIFLH